MSFFFLFQDGHWKFGLKDLPSEKLQLSNHFPLDAMEGDPLLNKFKNIVPDDISFFETDTNSRRPSRVSNVDNSDKSPILENLKAYWKSVEIENAEKEEKEIAEFNKSKGYETPFHYGRYPYNSTLDIPELNL